MASSPQAAYRYRYDPLDRLASSQPSNQAEVRAFYQKSRLATEIQGSLQRTLFQHDDYLLAQQQRRGTAGETSLLATDQQRSVLQRMSATERESLAYTAYGHRPADSGLSCLPGFNGERRDPVTGHYLLGNGYRAFNPVLMRFNSPDSLSPFGEGGLNAYAYCQGDPVNFRDPTGHAKYFNMVPKILRVRFKITDPLKRLSSASTTRAIATPVSVTSQATTVNPIKSATVQSQTLSSTAAMPSATTLNVEKNGSTSASINYHPDILSPRRLNTFTNQARRPLSLTHTYAAGVKIVKGRIEAAEFVIKHFVARSSLGQGDLGRNLQSIKRHQVYLDWYTRKLTELRDSQMLINSQMVRDPS